MAEIPASSARFPAARATARLASSTSHSPWAAFEIFPSAAAAESTRPALRSCRARSMKKGVHARVPTDSDLRNVSSHAYRSDAMRYARARITSGTFVRTEIERERAAGSTPPSRPSRKKRTRFPLGSLRHCPATSAGQS